MEDYELDFAKGWDVYFRNFDKSVQLRITKKVLQLAGPLSGRHLRFGLPFFVEEVGSYRIVFEIFESERKKRIVFVGNHKQYVKWYSKF
ncbi:MAG: hypothetical protein NT157_03260 [Candidatus Micrarchaeota archaeon]|nr:hypothetical protein [Candidatus Micrarchaeota archaeon]